MYKMIRSLGDIINYRDAQKNDPDAQTQIPKRLHKKKFEREIGHPVEIFPDAQIWEMIIILTF